MTSYNFANPYLSLLKERKELSHKSSLKKTYELIFDLKGSKISFQPGDCAVIFPQNDPEIVETCLSALSAQTEDTYFDPRSKTSYSVSDFLTYKANLNKMTSKLLKLVYLSQKNPAKKEKLQALIENTTALKEYLQNNHLIDLLSEFSIKHLKFTDVFPELLPLIPRFYSISSSLKYHPDELHLTISYLTYTTSNGQKHHGVTSHFMTQLAKPDTTKIPLYIQPNIHFHLPSENIPIIMIGAGTGIAPFLAFLEERKALKATGQNWLFFGEKKKAHNFSYQEFLTGLEKEKFLKLTTAFSRDQKDKIYVQHRLLENQDEIWKWIEKKAVIYVCGDAKRMAKDVEEALKTVIMKKRSCSEKEAGAFLQKMRAEKRYLKDVY